MGIYVLRRARQLAGDLMFRMSLPPLRRWLRSRWEGAEDVPPVNRQDSKSWGNHWCWSFTALSSKRLFEEHFTPGEVHVETFGNVLVAASFFYGLGQGELTRQELDHRDPDYEMLITLRARKGGMSA